VSKRIDWGKKWALLLAAVFLAGSMASAQQMSGDDGKRKAKVRSSPVYPELARHMNLSGKVRLEVVIAPDGHVKSSRAIGGHPVLVQSCVEALKDWRFEPGPEDTLQVIEFEFRP